MNSFLTPRKKRLLRGVTLLMALSSLRLMAADSLFAPEAKAEPAPAVVAQNQQSGISSDLSDAVAAVSSVAPIALTPQQIASLAQAANPTNSPLQTNAPVPAATPTTPPSTPAVTNTRSTVPSHKTPVTSPSRTASAAVASSAKTPATIPVDEPPNLQQ